MPANPAPIRSTSSSSTASVVVVMLPCLLRIEGEVDPVESAVSRWPSGGAGASSAIAEHVLLILQAGTAFALSLLAASDRRFDPCRAHARSAVPSGEAPRRGSS